MDLVDALGQWMPRQRWFSGKSHAPRLRVLDVVPHGDAATTYLVMDDAGERPTLYQVPVVAVVPGAAGDVPADAVIAEADGRLLLDAPRRHEFAVALLERTGVPTSAVTASTVLSGEQSNTSIVYREGETPTLIVKLFRTLHHGENPDVTLQSALSAAGSPFVPRFAGSLAGRWPDTGRADGYAEGTLGFAQEFLPGVRDGWTIAVEEARAGRSFEAAAHDLGVAVAGVHGILAGVMPTHAPQKAEVAALADGWTRRLESAAAEVPAIAARREEIGAVYRAARAESWPALQRVHGDLHLGQVLAVPDGGWRLVDFEGEPMRPMAERSLPDVALRDVAGMLRSFDYAAGASGEDRREWATVCGRAFLAGYREAGGDASPPALLAALVLDKGVYEALYEARNRPDWLGIPLGGIDQLLAHTGG